MPTTAPRHKRFVPTAIIVVVLLGQLAVSVVSVGYKWEGRQHAHQTWPFLDYPMYGYASGPPVETTVVNLTAVLENGKELDISQQFMGYSFFTWRYRIVDRVFAKRPSEKASPERAALVEAHRAEALEKILSQVAAVTPVRVVELRMGGDYYLAEGGQLIKKPILQVVDVSNLAAPTENAAVDPGLIDVQPKRKLGPTETVEAMEEMKRVNEVGDVE